MSHFNGDTANIVRYDTPALAGFTLSASWGEDDIWDIGANYEGALGGFQVAAAIAYTEITDEDDSNIVVGSFAVLHEPSGLNALIAAGQQSFDTAVLDNDGAFRTPAEATFIYAKLGWIANFNSFGHTSFFGEYGRFEDFASAGVDAGLIAQLDRTGGAAIRLTGNEVTVWGLGVVQRFEAADMDIYVAYRHREADFDLVNGVGGAVASNGLEDLHSVLVGSDMRRPFVANICDSRALETRNPGGR